MRLIWKFAQAMERFARRMVSLMELKFESSGSGWQHNSTDSISNPLLNAINVGQLNILRVSCLNTSISWAYALLERLEALQRLTFEYVDVDTSNLAPFFHAMQSVL